ncbi:MAG: helix-turn-helix transcriptional regulator, partial [Mycobacteriales bacterium]
VVLLAARVTVLKWLYDSSWIILLLAVLQLGLVDLEGLLESPYYSSCLIPVGIVAVSGRARLVWACALLIASCYAVAVFAAYSPARLAHMNMLGTALGALAAPAIAAVVLEGFTRSYEALVRRVVTRSLADPETTAPLLLNPPPPEPLTWEPLEPNELRVVQKLTHGGTSREIGQETGYAESTVNELLTSARHKTGARTREQLVALTAHPWFPDQTDEH